jgi:hypothetical protein
MRKTGVRERWARNKGSLRHGTVEWDLTFTFAVDVPAAGAVEGARMGVPERLVAGRCLEVRTTECGFDVAFRIAAAGHAHARASA